MTPIKLSIKLGIAAFGAFALAGCLGNGGSGGGGGAGGSGGTGAAASVTSYKALYATYSDPTALSNAPTSDMPSTGSAKYTGNVYLTNIAEAATPTNVVATDVLGDADLTVNFAKSGQSSITGTVGNIRGKDATGADFTWSTTFDTAHANGSGTLLTNENTITLPAPASGTVTTRAAGLNVILGADITATNAASLGTTGSALLTLGGNMMGSAGHHSIGTAQLAIDDNNKAGIIDYSGTGTYVLEKQ
ncbi:hypothetical protein [Pseudoprimorskyibacter insulae]|uniref:Transferrin-binding protein B C-lobe/N-lobe beta barrel domain-containing protein n=1 Tax=Pseudoprimorskyibacter insulae TaxID=1695997 RepID=A0A2R8AWC0_9RHOB|nr:hypothetical protein [Pseudoprimorskyibacter insulae]SPF80174.1 hypothetical protein PRI8871_01980 [Pseudoprimorskyibacter insulae]